MSSLKTLPSLPESSCQASPSSSKEGAINGAINGLSGIRRGSGPSPGTQGVARELPVLPEHPDGPGRKQPRALPPSPNAAEPRLEHEEAGLGAQENPKTGGICCARTGRGPRPLPPSPGVTAELFISRRRGSKKRTELLESILDGRKGQKAETNPWGAGGEGGERSSRLQRLPKTSGVDAGKRHGVNNAG